MILLTTCGWGVAASERQRVAWLYLSAPFTGHRSFVLMPGSGLTHLAFSHASGIEAPSPCYSCRAHMPARRKGCGRWGSHGTGWWVR